MIQKAIKNLVVVLFIVSIQNSFGQVSFDMEGNGIISSPYNTVRIPGIGGTSFDLSKDFDSETFFTYRLRGLVTIKERHVFSLLYAPLTIKYSGNMNQPLFYNGKTFSPGKPIDATYKFNSYRFTYRYKIVKSENWEFALGLSAKIRDASISLSNDSINSEYPNVGFVPLINFYASWQFVKNIRLVIEGDALASKQGRAEDLFAGLYFNILKSVAIKGGYRILEGGADNEKVYNFTMVNYGALGVVIEI